MELHLSLRRCCGHGTEKHVAPLSIRTAGEDTITFPEHSTLALLTDIKEYVRDDAPSPAAAEAHCTCKKCKLGSETDQEHTYEKGKCRLYDANNPKRGGRPALPPVLQPGQASDAH